ncbi:helix-turn-helix transcriptional regulator [Saezia sanguinis]|nr:AlpA family phage regulatory protein [Saezia sanguinis]
MRILRIKEVGKLVGLSRSSIYTRLDPESRVYDKTFPQRIQLGGGSIGFRAGEVYEWIASRPTKKK